MLNKNVPVDVICVCSANGEIQPLRFRIEDENNCLIKGNIEQVLDVKHIEYVGVESTVFLCIAMVEGQEWVFELRYMIRSHCWKAQNFGIANCRQIRYNGLKYRKQES